MRALDESGRVLIPQGLIIDLHPSVDRAQVICDLAGRRVVAGPLHRYVDDIRDAERILRRYLRQNRLRLEVEEKFIFRYHAADLDELLDYLKSEWSEARIDPPTQRKVRKLLDSASGPCEVLIEEAVVAARLRKIEPGLRAPRRRADD